MNTAVGAMPEENVQVTTPAYLPWLVCFAASLFFFYEFMQLNMFNAIDPSLMREFHITAARLGQLSANYFYATILFLFPAGMLLDRFSARKIILCGMVASVASTVVFSFATSLTVAEVCRFITGLAGCFPLLSAIRLASRWFPAKRMALVIGLIVTIAMLGGMLAQTPLTLLTDNFGWRKALWVDAGVGALMFIFMAAVIRDYPPGHSANLKDQHQQLHGMGFWPSMRLVTANLQNWLAGLYTCLLNLPIFLLGSMWGSMYLVQSHGLSRTESSYVTSMIFIGTIIGSPVLGWLSDRLARRKLPMIVFAILSLAIILIMMSLQHLTLSVAMLMFFLIGFLTSAQIISYPLVAESNPRALTASASGLSSVLIMAGGISQPFFGWLMGLHWDHHMVDGVPFYSHADYLLAMSIMPIAFVIGLIAVFFVKETRCRPQD